MTVDFVKMNGAGNDFVLIDNRSGAVRLSADQIRRLCDRQRGVGADGLMLLVPSRGRGGEWAWDFYNSDGSEADMCGNGARCFARFVQRLVPDLQQFGFETGAGLIRAQLQGAEVTVNLTAPHGLTLDQRVETSSGPRVVHSLNTGVPHAVVFVEEADKAMVAGLGRELRYHPHFAPKGTNVNFVQVLAPGRIRVRTYERGVEGETLACGTGVAASAMISAKVHGFASPVEVQVLGGDLLRVGFEAGPAGFQDVRLSGPADFVFQGRIEL